MSTLPKIETLQQGIGKKFCILLRRVGDNLDLALGVRWSWRLDESLITVAPAAPAPDDPSAAVEAVLQRWPSAPVVLLARKHPTVDGQYDPTRDAIWLFRGTGLEPIEKLIVLLHEAAHSSGHARRLRRPSLADYAVSPDAEEAEECIAALCSLLVAHRTGIRKLEHEDSLRCFSRVADLDDEEKIRAVVHEADAAANFILNPA